MHFWEASGLLACRSLWTILLVYLLGDYFKNPSYKAFITTDKKRIFHYPEYKNKYKFTFITSLYYKASQFTRPVRLFDEYIIVGNVRQTHISNSVLSLHIVWLMNALTCRDENNPLQLPRSLSHNLGLGVNEPETRGRTLFPHHCCETRTS